MNNAPLTIMVGGVFAWQELDKSRIPIDTGRKDAYNLIVSNQMEEDTP